MHSEKASCFWATNTNLFYKFTVGAATVKYTQNHWYAELFWVPQPKQINDLSEYTTGINNFSEYTTGKHFITVIICISIPQV